MQMMHMFRDCLEIMLQFSVELLTKINIYKETNLPHWKQTSKKKFTAIFAVPLQPLIALLEGHLKPETHQKSMVY